MKVLEPPPGSRTPKGSNTTKCQHSQEDPRTSMKVPQPHEVAQNSGLEDNPET